MVPTHDRIMLPLLRQVRDGGRHRYKELFAALANEFALTETDLSILNESGDPKFEKNTRWSKTFLCKAGLLQGNGFAQITPKGLDVLQLGLDGIDDDFLMQYPEFRAWKNKEARSEADEASKGIARQPDLLRRIKVEEAAIQAASNHFIAQGFSVDSVERDNVGWDLEARNGDICLRLEVKGLSGHDNTADLTPNEYKAMQRAHATYRVCIVTNALTSPVLRIFGWSDIKRGWFDQNNVELTVTEVISARMSAPGNTREGSNRSR